MVAPNWFNYKGVSSLDNGIIIKSKQTHNGAGRDVTYQSIPGRSGDLIIDNNRFLNVLVSYTVEILENEAYSLPELTRKIKGWLLSDVGYFRLYDSYDSKYFRLAACTDELDISEDVYGIGNCTIAFNCKPFKYAFDGQNNIKLTESGTITNPEQYPSRPYIKITGNGDITLSINNDSFVFSDVDEFIEIDSEIMNAFKGAIPQNNKMRTPFFPSLEPGENNISWTGNVAGVEIIPRWCCR